MPRIHLKNLGKTITANTGLSLLNNFLTNDIPIHTVCGGKAMCGCCRIRIIAGEKGVNPISNAEIHKLGKDLAEAGWRLSCQTYCLKDITVIIPTAAELDGHCSKK